MLLQTRLLLFVLHRLHLCIFVILCIQNTNRVSSVIVRWIRICIVCRNFGCIGFRKNAQIFLISYARWIWSIICPKAMALENSLIISSSQKGKRLQSLSAIDMYLTTAYQSYSYIAINECNEIPDFSLQF